MIKVVLNILLVITLGIIQVSFLTTWPEPVSSLNIILSLVIFLAIIINYQKGLWVAFGSGLFVELFSGYPFGVSSLTLMLTVIFINFLFNNFFTNRSLYSLMILGFIATVFHNLMVTGLIFGLGLVDASADAINFSFITQYFWQPFFNLIILAIIFFVYYFLTGRLKNIFLFPNKL